MRIIPLILYGLEVLLGVQTPLLLLEIIIFLLEYDLDGIEEVFSCFLLIFKDGEQNTPDFCFELCY